MLTSKLRVLFFFLLGGMEEDSFGFFSLIVNSCLSVVPVSLFIFNLSCLGGWSPSFWLPALLPTHVSLGGFWSSKMCSFICAPPVPDLPSATVWGTQVAFSGDWCLETQSERCVHSLLLDYYYF